MRKLRELFTKWYVKRGWTWAYKTLMEDCDIEVEFDCPWYIKPLLFLFSPSVYTAEALGKNCILAGLEEGFRRAREDPMVEAFRANILEEELEPYSCPECGSEATVWIQENKRLGLDLYYCGCQKCGYGRFSYTYGRNGAIVRWNNFVLRYKENVDQPLFKED